MAEAALISVSGELGIRNKFIFITSECFLPRYIVHTSSLTANIAKLVFYSKLTLSSAI